MYYLNCVLSAASKLTTLTLQALACNKLSGLAHLLPYKHAPGSSLHIRRIECFSCLQIGIQLRIVFPRGTNIITGKTLNAPSYPVCSRIIQQNLPLYMPHVMPYASCSDGPLAVASMPRRLIKDFAISKRWCSCSVLAASSLHLLC